MALTPDEIVSYDLKQAVRGYSIAQVDELLDLLADQVEAADREREQLLGRLREAEQRTQAAQEAESTLSNTLITAQQAADRRLQEAREEAEQLIERASAEAAEIRASAQEESERLLDEARVTASAEIADARQQRAALQDRLDQLVEQERRHRERFRQELEQQLAELDGTSGEVAPPAGAPSDLPPPPGGVSDPDEGHLAAPDRAPEHGRGHPEEPGAGGLRVRVHERPDDPQVTESSGAAAPWTEASHEDGR